MNEARSNWDVMSQWSGGVNDRLELFPIDRVSPTKLP